VRDRVSLRDLWSSARGPGVPFQPDMLPDLPEGARRYLMHAMNPGTPLASAVRLTMRGEIRLKGWVPFRADQVIHAERGMIWDARLRLLGIPIRGSDRIVDGAASMRWKLFGLIPFLSASGPDITRSAAGRLCAESVWLPSIFCRPDVVWSEPDSTRLRAAFGGGPGGSLELTIGDRGELRSVRVTRWGNPEGRSFHDVGFGAIIQEERTWSGITIPARLRVGWYFGSDRFESEGEFIRISIERARYG
jgi:hypothetical protein